MSRSDDEAAQLIAAHDENPPAGPWDRCDGCHVDYVRALLERAQRAEARGDEWRAIAEYGLHLAMYGERAPGGDETWREFERRMRAQATRDAAALAAEPSELDKETS